MRVKRANAADVGGPVSLLDFMICSVDWARIQTEQLCFPIGDPPLERREDGVNAILSGVSICMPRRVCCKWCSFAGPIRHGYSYRHQLSSYVPLGAF